jgi:branched-chain amino acid transport system ATP-binding protein
MLLEVTGLNVHYGKTAAVRDVSLEVPDGGIVTIIGANGAGKTTTLRAISGLNEITSGEIRYRGERLNDVPAERIVAMGIAHVPEGRRVFPDLTVWENLHTGAFLRRDKPAVRQDLEHVFELFPVLKARRSQWAKTLSGGEQQMLALARVLAAPPKLLVADEMSLGLAPRLVDLVFESLARARDEGVSILLIEQYVERALGLASEAVILRRGRVGWHGPAAEAHGELVAGYLGTDS